MQQPMALIFLFDKWYGSGVFLTQQVTGQCTHPQVNGISLFTAKHKDVSVHLSVFLFMNPFIIKHLHVFHSSQFESLVYARRQFMTTHILIPVHHQIRFHQTVLLGLTMS